MSLVFMFGSTECESQNQICYGKSNIFLDLSLYSIDKFNPIVLNPIVLNTIIAKSASLPFFYTGPSPY